MTDTNILTFPPCEASEDLVPIVICAYTALTRFGTEQCDLPVEDAESVDQDEREFCTGHCADVKRNEVEDRYIDVDYS